MAYWRSFLRDERQAEDVVFLRFRCSNNPFLFSTTEAETQQVDNIWPSSVIRTRSLITTTTTILTTNNREKKYREKKENNTTLLIILSIKLLVCLQGNFFILKSKFGRNDFIITFQTAAFLFYDIKKGDSH
jgi:hypothetical protein